MRRESASGSVWKRDSQGQGLSSRPRFTKQNQPETKPAPLAYHSLPLGCGSADALQRGRRCVRWCGWRPWLRPLRTRCWARGCIGCGVSSRAVVLANGGKGNGRLM